MVVVAIVGIDGSGKTTQAKMLVDSLRRKGYAATYVEPAFMLLQLLGNTEQTDLLSKMSPRKSRTSVTGEERRRGLRLGRVLIAILGYTYALLTYLLIAHKSNKEGIIVCDRYFFQFFFDLFGEYADSIIDIFPKPDITLFLDGQLDSLHSRMVDPSDASTSKAYFVEVGSLFEGISKKYDFIRVNAELRADLIANEIVQEVVDSLGVQKYG